MVKNLPANVGDIREEVRRIPWRRAWQPTPVFLPEEAHGQRTLAGYPGVAKRPWVHDCRDILHT